MVSYGSRFLSIGSRVDLYYGGKKITKQLNPVKGFQSSSSYNLNFGLGKSPIVDSLKIIWADGKKQTHYKYLNHNDRFNKKQWFKQDSSNIDNPYELYQNDELIKEDIRFMLSLKE